MNPPPSDPAPPDPRDALFDTAHMMGNLGRRAGKASIILLAMSVAKVLLQIISISVVARLIPPSEYGIFAAALPAILLSMALSNFGLPQAVVQKDKITHAEVTMLFWLNIGFGLTATLVVFLLAGPAARYFAMPELRAVIQVVSISPLLGTMVSQYLAILRRTLRIWTAESITFLSNVIGVVVVVIAALSGLSYWALVLRQLVVPLVSLVLLARATKWMPSAPVPGHILQARGSVKFGGFVAGTAILDKMTEYLGTFLVGGAYGHFETGIFQRARSLAAMPAQYVMTPLTTAFVPTLSRLQDQPAEMNAMFQRLVGRTNIVLMPVAVVMAAGAAPLVQILLGPEWAEVTPLMAWMSVFVLISPCQWGLRAGMMAQGRANVLFWFNLVRLGLLVAVMLSTLGLGLPHMTGAYALTELVIVLGLIVVAGKWTLLGTRHIARTCVPDMVFAIACVVVWVGAFEASTLGASNAVQLMWLCCFVGLAYGLRIVISPPLRADLMRIVSLVKGKLAT